MRRTGRDEQERPSGGLFRGNRSLAITLLDILLVLLMFGIYMLFFGPDPDAGPGSATTAGYRFEGSAFRFENEVYATVTIGVANGDAPVDADAAPARDGEETLVSIDFPDGTTVTDVLPSRPDFATTVRHVFAERELTDDTGEADDAELVPLTITFSGGVVELAVPLGE